MAMIAELGGDVEPAATPPGRQELLPAEDGEEDEDGQVPDERPRLGPSEQGAEGRSRGRRCRGSAALRMTDLKLRSSLDRPSLAVRHRGHLARGETTTQRGPRLSTPGAGSCRRA